MAALPRLVPEPCFEDDEETEPLAQEALDVLLLEDADPSDPTLARELVFPTDVSVAKDAPPAIESRRPYPVSRSSVPPAPAQPRGALLIAGMLVAFIWLPAFAAAAIVALR